jgi:septal ring factor EnvC (AmiA/AmiB activator)
MNRARTVKVEWDTRVAECGALTPGEARKNDELTRLRAKLAERTRECTQLHQRLDAAATAIAALHHDNTLLRQEIDRTGGIVTLVSRRSG